MHQLILIIVGVIELELVNRRDAWLKPQNAVQSMNFMIFMRCNKRGKKKIFYQGRKFCGFFHGDNDGDST